MNNIDKLPKWGNSGHGGVNLDSGKKGQVLVKLKVPAVLSMIWAKKSFRKVLYFF